MNKTTPLARPIAVSAEDPGTIEGYLAVFGNVDAAGEIIRKGAFARSISEAVPAGKVPLMARHFRDGGDALECVGTLIAAREDDFGLWVRARFSSDPAAQALRIRVNEGHISRRRRDGSFAGTEVRSVRSQGLRGQRVHGIQPLAAEPRAH